MEQFTIAPDQDSKLELRPDDGMGEDAGFGDHPGAVILWHR